MTMNADKPLIGDEYGIYRVNIVGNSGVGKSTLARELAHILNVPCIHLDLIFWKPNWGKPETEDFERRIRELLDSPEFANGWVVDGSYQSILGNLISSRATDVIWLDTPFLLYFPRLLMRTISRLIELSPPCAPGCGETFASVFLSRDSILWWCITRHYPTKKRQAAAMKSKGIDVGGNMRRIGGWGREPRIWKASVEKMRTEL